MIHVLNPNGGVGIVELTINRVSDQLFQYSNKDPLNLFQSTYKHYILEEDGDHVLDIIYFILDSLGLSNDYDKFLKVEMAKFKGEEVF